ncbi:MAG: hypothetical protein CFH21_00820 [Alphaproteobacteria bacterium MarineAlpha5_Bin11]|nr:hypothetical protein [Pelagibacteraceae bacterium]PPR43350.1 MAG: hypothetical protein CFH21_00820 [Alphaproteobacteria bacterium MarineAlpha5_Bin11]PPR52034.1 MAG: hypothetical protein CFH20_00222 [Alphaproteobacteria bacterium MarineAlpha5_Bin10]
MIDLLQGLISLIKFDFGQFITIFNGIQIELSWFLFLFFCLSSILIFLKLFGEIGLYIYTIVAVIAGNIQVLKVVKFSFFLEPVALGTILFSSIFLCTDILAEYYGSKSARKNVIFGFSAFLLMTLIMLFTLGFKPINLADIGPDYYWAIEVQDHLLNIFQPLPTLFIASMIAYLTSQYFDIWFYKLLSRLTNNKYLWIRNNISTMTSSLVDNSVFSIFAFIILAQSPLKISVVVMTYIIGTYFLRVFIALIDTPFIYAAKYVIKR